MGFVSGSRVLLAAISAAGVALFTATSDGVESPPQPGEPGLQVAGVPKDIPNISGMWQNRGYDRRIAPVDAAHPPWQPWNKAAFDARVAAEKAGKPLYDPTAACRPSGTPRIIAAPYPVEIVQTPTETVFLYEAQHLFRIVHMNAKHPARVEPSYLGHAVGKWEGDTLIIDTIGLVKDTQIDEAGTQHSEQLHVIERIRKVNDTLEILFTIEDPKAFTKPWTAKRVWHWRPDVRMLEYICEENNRNAPDEHGVLKNY
jgi:hypothetical protein